MGHRANFIVIEGGIATAYCDQWAAMGCVYSFAEGPIVAVEALSELEVIDELLDWAFAEGGYLVDRDKKVGIVFGMTLDDEEAFDGVPEETLARLRSIDEALAVGEREYLNLIAPQWKGWKISWDDRGVDAFALYLQDRQIKEPKCQPPEIQILPPRRFRLMPNGRPRPGDLTK